MAIPPISPLNTQNTLTKKRPFITPVSATGYGALIAGGASVVTAVNKKIKTHKYLAYLAGALAIAHTAIIEIQRFNRNK